MNTTQMALIMMAVFVIKHKFCDFNWQTPYMMGKFKAGSAWIMPLFAHTSVHAIMSLAIIIAFNKPAYAWLALIELVVHFIIDRIKATYKLPQGVWTEVDKARNKTLWYNAFANDQMAHYLTYVAMLFIMFS